MTTSKGKGMAPLMSATATRPRATNVPAAPMLTRSSFLANAAVEKAPEPPTLAARRKTTLVAADLPIFGVLHVRVVDDLGDVEALHRRVRGHELIAAVVPGVRRDLGIDRE